MMRGDVSFQNVVMKARETEAKQIFFQSEEKDYLPYFRRQTSMALRLHISDLTFPVTNIKYSTGSTMD